jgi:hypothetical protein
MTDKKTENWQKAKERLKIEYPELADTDLEFNPEEDSEKLDELVAKTRKTREEIRSWLHFMG